MSSAQDHRWMAQALRLARRGLYSTHPNPRVGCVVVKDGEFVAGGWHEYHGGPHAEVNAIESAQIPAGAEFYVTLEPCSHQGKTPPCVDALIAREPARVVAAMQDPNPQVGGRGLELLRARGIDVVCGVMEAQARALNPGFCKRMERGLPFVSIKLATSLDGRTALANGASRWISGEAARRDVQFERARASAILTSAQTVIDDDPSLNLRLERDDLGQSRALRHPLRVVVDSRLRLRGDEKLFATEGEILIYTMSEDDAALQNLRDRGAWVVTLAAGNGNHVDLGALLRDLADRGINEVHTECGKTLAGALIRGGFADRMLLYLAPHLLGDLARGAVDLGELTAMEQRIETRIHDLRQIGDDLRLTLRLD